MKLIRKKNYDKLINEIEAFKIENEILKYTLEISDTCLCETRKSKKELELMLDLKSKTLTSLHNTLANKEKELNSQKLTNKRLINYLFGPKKK